MRRALAGVAAMLLLFCTSTMASYVGLLGELVPWPMMVSAAAMTSISLTDSPPEKLAGSPPVSPSGRQLMYGLLPLGSGADRGVLVVVAMGTPPRVWIDRDNDEDLSDEAELLPPSEIFHDTFGWYETVRVEYEAGQETTQSSHHLCLLADQLTGSADPTLFYCGFSHRLGLLDLGGATVPIALGTLRNDARYDDPASLIVAVDTNGDGEIDMLPGSTDVYGPGEKLQIGQTLYVIESVSPDGRRIVVEEAGIAAPRPVIAPGELAPEFVLMTEAGVTVRLSDFRGRPVVLLLAQLREAPECTTCGRIEQDLPRVSLAEELSRSYGDRIAVLIVITNDQALGLDSLSLDCPSVLLAHDPAVAVLYRRPEGLFILDGAGVIADMDVAWSTIRCGRGPEGAMDLLSYSDVLEALDKLLSK